MVCWCQPDKERGRSVHLEWDAIIWPQWMSNPDQTFAGEWKDIIMVLSYHRRRNGNNVQTEEWKLSQLSRVWCKLIIQIVTNAIATSKNKNIHPCYPSKRRVLVSLSWQMSVNLWMQINHMKYSISHFFLFHSASHSIPLPGCVEQTIKPPTAVIIL